MMVGPGRAVLIELRHRTSILMLIAAALAVLVMLWSRGSEWGGRWNELGALLRQSMLVVGPLCVVFGAWQGGESGRSGALELFSSTPRSALQRTFQEIVGLAVAGCSGVLLGYTSAAWTILRVGGYWTEAAPLYLIGIVPAVFVYVSLGYLAGRLAPWRITAPLVGIAAYAILGLALAMNEKAAVLLGVGWLGGTEDFSFDTDGWLWGVVILTCAAFTFVAASGVERRPGRSVLWIPFGLGLGLASLFALPMAVVAAEGGKGPYPAIADPALACTSDSGPRVCVLAGDRHALATIVPIARRTLNGLSGIAGAPTWAGPELAHETSTPPDRLNVIADLTTPWGKPDRSDGGRAYVDSSGLFLPDIACPGDPATGYLSGDPDGIGVQLSSLVVPWIDSGAAPDSGSWRGWEVADPSALSTLQLRFLASTNDQRRAYASGVLSALRACNGAGIAKAARNLASK